MARKQLRFAFDAPTTTVFAILGVLVYLADVLSHNFLIPGFCVCRSLKAIGDGAELFDFKNVIDYVRIFLHVFAGSSWEMVLLNSLLVLLLGPQLEERYGTPMLSLMMVLTALVTGVLDVCTGCLVITGAEGIIFMMIVLISLTAFARHKLPVSWVFIFLCYTAYRVHYYTFLPRASTSFATDNSVMALLQKNIPLLIDLAGGIVGSLFGFFIQPRKHGGRGFADDDATLSFSEAKSRRGRPDDETVVDTRRS